MIKQVHTDIYDDNFSYFVIDQKSKAALVVDPGDMKALEFVIDQDGLILKGILVTHSHHDHVGAVNEMVEKYGVPVYMHKMALGRVDVLQESVVAIEEGETIKVGEIVLEVLYTPGHIDDAVCYYIKEKNSDDGVPKLISGDTLFVEGCGRADLDGSNVEDLYNSLQRLKKLPPETKVYSGHDYGSKPVSTIAWEKIHNQYMKCKSFEEFSSLRLSV